MGEGEEREGEGDGAGEDEGVALGLQGGRTQDHAPENIE